MKKLIAIVVTLVIVVVLLWRVDYAFYNPRLGVAATGADVVSNNPHERETLQLTITDEHLRRFNNRLTLTRLVEFYGTEKSLPCSVRATFNTNDVAVAQRPLRRGSIVAICLN